MNNQPNILFVFADQWRAQAFGYAGDTNVKTPTIDAFAQENINFSNAVSGCPVCTPYRASLMTGVYPNKHKLMVNDQSVYDRYDGPFLAECLREGGYKTAYVGKWHIDGKGRNAFVPHERRLGFDWWKGFECSHDYQDSYYYFGDDPRPYKWDGYDGDAQTEAACEYLKTEVGDDPFALFVSWGPPHNPFGTAPEKYEAMYNADEIILPPNVPEDVADRARRELAGYYAHCSALDAAFGRLLTCLKEAGLEENTIVVFTADHGDMLGSQGEFRKQRPWAESNRVPLLIRHPEVNDARVDTTPVDAPDWMPTLLSLAGIEIPQSVQGNDFSKTITSGASSGIDAALLSLYSPFHEWTFKTGGREYRGLHDRQFTYARTLEGPWLLYDDVADPYQMKNLVDHPDYAEVVAKMDDQLTERLEIIGDDFASAKSIIEREGYALGSGGDIAIAPSKLPEPY